MARVEVVKADTQVTLTLSLAEVAALFWAIDTGQAGYERATYEAVGIDGSKARYLAGQIEDHLSEVLDDEGIPH